jgi:hypothetical protein
MQLSLDNGTRQREMKGPEIVASSRWDRVERDLNAPLHLIEADAIAMLEDADHPHPSHRCTRRQLPRPKVQKQKTVAYSRKCQTSTATPAEPFDLPFGL